MRVWSRYSVYFAVGLLGFAPCVNAQNSHVGKLTGHVAAGKIAFPRYCDGCHGVRGDGAGTFAPYLDPRPRDYTMGVFKFRSTPSGSLPTDSDLYSTITRGVVTAAMPSWASLTPQTRVDLIAYIKTFSPRFAKEPPPTPITIGPETKITIESIRRGADLYRKLGCARCHGELGRGNGPDADTLMDIKNRPDPPYDFTVTARFKSGYTNRDLYRAYMTGLDGSPMPSFADKLTPDQAWDLVHFTRTLQVKRKSEERRVLEAAGGRNALEKYQP